MNTVYYYSGSGTIGSFLNGHFSNGFGNIFGFTLTALYGPFVEAKNPTSLGVISAPGTLPSVPKSVIPTVSLYNKATKVATFELVSSQDYLSSDGLTVLGKYYFFLTPTIQTQEETFFAKWYMPNYSIVFGTDSIHVAAQEGNSEPITTTVSLVTLEDVADDAGTGLAGVIRYRSTQNSWTWFAGSNTAEDFPIDGGSATERDFLFRSISVAGIAPNIPPGTELARVRFNSGSGNSATVFTNQYSAIFVNCDNTGFSGYNFAEYIPDPTGSTADKDVYGNTVNTWFFLVLGTQYPNPALQGGVLYLDQLTPKTDSGGNQRFCIFPNGYVGINLDIFNGIVPQARFHIRDTSSTTNTARTGFIFGHHTTDTPAAGFGSSWQIQLDTTTTTDVNCARLAFSWATALGGSYKGRIIHYVSDSGGERKAIQIDTDGTKALVGIGGQVKIGPIAEDQSLVASAAFEIDSTTQGALLPRMTTIQKNAIVSPAEGLEVYDTTIHAKCLFNGSVWTTESNAPVVADADATTITMDWSSGSWHSTTITASRIIAFSNDFNGGEITIIFDSGGTGVWTPVWPSAVKWQGGTAPVLTNVGGHSDLVTIKRQSSGNYIGKYTLNFF